MEVPINKEREAESGWMRAAYILLFLIMLKFSIIAFVIVVIIHFAFTLFQKEETDGLKKFKAELTEYIFELINFLIGKNEIKPFPISEWPSKE